MTNLETLVNNITETKKLADTDLEAAPWQTRPSLTNMKVEARERLEKLVAEYTKAIRANSIGIFLNGNEEDVAKFVAIANEEAGTYAVRADALYTRLADGIEPSLGSSREFGGTQLQGLIQGLRQAAKDLDILGMSLPGLTDTPVVNTRQDLVDQVKRLVRGAVGDDMVRIALNRDINDQAVASKFSGGTLPVIVLGTQPEEVAALAPLFTNSISITVNTAEDGEVTKETVLKQFGSIKKKLKTRPQTETQNQ